VALCDLDESEIFLHLNLNSDALRLATRAAEACNQLAKDRGSNFISYNNPEVDKIIEDARLEFDAQKRKHLYWRFQQIIHDEQPYTFLFYPEESAAYSKRFHNVMFLPPRPNYDLSSWFVPVAEQKHMQVSAR
jgi:ABC-type transport system substrate-binding protein